MVTKCLHCGKPLSFVKRLQNDRHCSEECYAQYIRKQDETALTELTRRKAAEAHGEPPDPAEGEATPAVAMAVAAGNDSVPELWRLEQAALEQEVLEQTAEAKPEGEPEEGLEERYSRFLSIVEAERHYYQDILDRLPAGVAICSGDLSLEYGNRWFRKELRLDADDLAGAKLSGLFAQEDVIPAMNTLFDEPERGEVHVKGAVGDNGRWDLVLAPMALRDGEAGRQVLVFVERSA